jgi:hypothetical protein
LGVSEGVLQAMCILALIGLGVREGVLQSQAFFWCAFSPRGIHIFYLIGEVN